MRYLSTLIAGAAVVLVTAACGGSGDDGAEAAGADSGQSAFTAYVECMKKNGVTLTVPTGRPEGMSSGRPGARPSGSALPRPDGTANPRPSGSPRARQSGDPGGGRQGGMFTKPDGVDDAVWNKAVEACQSVRPSMGAGRGNQGDQNGGNPNAGNGTQAAYENCLKEHGVATPAQADATDSKVAAALAACKVLSPAPTAS